MIPNADFLNDVYLCVKPEAKVYFFSLYEPGNCLLNIHKRKGTHTSAVPVLSDTSH